MRAQSYIGLPEGYELSREIDLQKDKKLAFWLNAAAAVAMLALLLPVLPRLGALPWGTALLAPSLALLFGTFAYLVLHEWVHGIFIRLFCGQKAEYGFTAFMLLRAKRAPISARRTISSSLWRRCSSGASCWRFSALWRRAPGFWRHI